MYIGPISKKNEIPLKNCKIMVPFHTLGSAIEEYLKAGSLHSIYQDFTVQRRQTLHNVSLRAFPQLLESLHSGQHFIRSQSQDC